MTNEQIKTTLTSFMDEVWNQGNFTHLQSMICESYQILSDPGDPWNGQEIDVDTFRKRVSYTRSAFPDVHFNVHEMIAEDQRVAIRWNMTGTHTGDLPNLPATRRKFNIEGMTFYYFRDGKIYGHRQAFDQLGFLAQIGRLALTPATAN